MYLAQYMASSMLSSQMILLCELFLIPFLGLNSIVSFDNVIHTSFYHGDLEPISSHLDTYLLFFVLILQYKDLTIFLVLPNFPLLMDNLCVLDVIPLDI